MGKVDRSRASRFLKFRLKVYNDDVEAVYKGLERFDKSKLMSDTTTAIRGRFNRILERAKDAKIPVTYYLRVQYPDGGHNDGLYATHDDLMFAYRVLTEDYSQKDTVPHKRRGTV